MSVKQIVEIMLSHVEWYDKEGIHFKLSNPDGLLKGSQEHRDWRVAEWTKFIEEKLNVPKIQIK